MYYNNKFFCSIKTYFLLFMVLTLLSCTSTKQIANYQTIKDCRSKWIFKDLEMKDSIKILLIEYQMRRDLVYFPNFIIGVTNDGDTIGVLDRINHDIHDFGQKGKRINIIPSRWSEEEKNNKKPVFRIYKDPNDFNLICRALTIYYGAIEIKPLNN